MSHRMKKGKRLLFSLCSLSLSRARASLLFSLRLFFLTRRALRRRAQKSASRGPPRPRRSPEKHQRRTSSRCLATKSRCRSERGGRGRRQRGTPATPCFFFLKLEGGAECRRGGGARGRKEGKEEARFPFCSLLAPSLSASPQVPQQARKSERERERKKRHPSFRTTVA